MLVVEKEWSNLPQKIVHVNSYFYGNDVHARLVESIRDKGFQQQVFVPRIIGESPNSLGGKDFEILDPECFSKIDRLLWPLKIVKIWKNFKRSIPLPKGTLLHAHSLVSNGLIALFGKKAYGIPFVVTIRNTDIHFFLMRLPVLFRPIAINILRSADQVITLSPTYWESTKKLLRLRSNENFILDEKHHLIPSGADDFWFSHRLSTKNREKTLRLLFVGRIDKNKNLRLVLSACRKLKLQNFPFELKVVGEGPEYLSCCKEARNLPVSFLGYKRRKEELLAVYRDSDVLVLPSKHESFGVVYVEALTQGLPLIYTKGQGFDKFYPDGDVGFPVNSSNSDDLACAIRKIASDYTSISARTLKAADTFRWDRIGDSLTGIYKSILKY